MYQGSGRTPLLDMHMITPGIAASLTPKSVDRTPRAEATPRARRRLHVPQVLLHVPHPHFHLPQRQA
jgi:hypothetical protein